MRLVARAARPRHDVHRDTPCRAGNATTVKSGEDTVTTPTPPGSDPSGTQGPYGSGPDPYGGAGYGSGYGSGPAYGPGYGYPSPPPQQAPRNGFGIAGLVLGIVSMVLFWCYGIPGILAGILGLIFGILGIRRARRGEATMGLGVAGVILSSVGLVLSAATIAFFGWFFTNILECANVEKYPTEDAQNRCIEEIFG